MTVQELVDKIGDRYNYARICQAWVDNGSVYEQVQTVWVEDVQFLKLRTYEVKGWHECETLGARTLEIECCEKGKQWPFKEEKEENGRKNENYRDR